MSSRCDIVIAGVGGQGILLASDILGEACIREGLPVKGLETHGMAQRGGSVEAHVRIGCARGPKVPLGGADLLIGFEPLEASRLAAWLKPGGAAVVNSAAVPVPGGAAYPPVESLRGILAARAGALLRCRAQARGGRFGADGQRPDAGGGRALPAAVRGRPPRRGLLPRQAPFPRCEPGGVRGRSRRARIARPARSSSRPQRTTGDASGSKGFVLSASEKRYG